MEYIILISSLDSLMPTVPNLIGEVTGAIAFLFLYEILVKNTYFYLKTAHLNGKYYHYDRDHNYCYAKGSNISCSILKIRWREPFQININSVDFNDEGSKSWVGTYKIDSSLKYAFGYWKYDNNIDVGNHVLQFINQNDILVQLTTHTQAVDVQYWKKIRP